jgi:hypothetical protein
LPSAAAHAITSTITTTTSGKTAPPAAERPGACANDCATASTPPPTSAAHAGRRSRARSKTTTSLRLRRTKSLRASKRSREAGQSARERLGRRNRYSLSLDRPLRHPLEAHRTIAEVIRVIET